MNLSPSDYHVEVLSETSGNVAWIMLAAGLAFASPPETPRATVPALTITARPSTVGQFGNVFANLLPPRDVAPDIARQEGVDFEGEVATFYSTLLAKQEPLGKEFEQVLYENLWDLYIRS